jgi:hypothetical protein
LRWRSSGVAVADHRRACHIPRGAARRRPAFVAPQVRDGEKIGRVRRVMKRGRCSAAWCAWSGATHHWVTRSGSSRGARHPRRGILPLASVISARLRAGAPGVRLHSTPRPAARKCDQCAASRRESACARRRVLVSITLPVTRFGHGQLVA